MLLNQIQGREIRVVLVSSRLVGEGKGLGDDCAAVTAGLVSIFGRSLLLFRFACSLAGLELGGVCGERKRVGEEQELWEVGTASGKSNGTGEKRKKKKKIEKK